MTETCGMTYPHVWHSRAEPSEGQTCICGQMVWHRGGREPTPVETTLPGRCWCESPWDDHGLPSVACQLRLP